MARAIRRCGELLKQVEASKGGQPTHKSTQEGTLLSIPTRESGMTVETRPQRPIVVKRPAKPG